MELANHLQADLNQMNATRDPILTYGIVDTMIRRQRGKGERAWAWECRPGIG